MNLQHAPMDFGALIPALMVGIGVTLGLGLAAIFTYGEKPETDL